MNAPGEHGDSDDKPTELVARRSPPPPVATTDDEATRVLAAGVAKPASKDTEATLVLDQANAPTLALYTPPTPQESAPTQVMPHPVRKPRIGDAPTGVSLPEGEIPQPAASTEVSVPRMPVVQMGALRTGASASPSAARTAGSAEGRSELPEVGDTIKGRFELIEELGRGGMGAVFRARDLRKIEALDPDPYVAIKFISGALIGFDRAFVALQREAKNAQALNHPNIVKVFDFDRDDGMVFLTMEVVKGVPLHRRLRELDTRPMDDAERRHLGHGLLAGMAYAHARGLSHADLKPSNMMIDEEGELKILDFGIARRTEYDTVFDADDLFALTIDYASPEMLARKRPLPADDVYALGCILHALHGGGHPFDHVRADQAREEKRRPVRPASATRVQWQALRKALAFRREDRFADAAAFLRAYEGRDWRRIGSMGAVALALAASIAWVVADPVQSWVNVSRLPAEQQETLQRSLRDGSEYLTGGYAEDAVFAFSEALALDPHNTAARRGARDAFDAMRASMPSAQYREYLALQAGDAKNAIWLKDLATAELARLPPE